MAVGSAVPTQWSSNDTSIQDELNTLSTIQAWFDQRFQENAVWGQSMAHQNIMWSWLVQE